MTIFQFEKHIGQYIVQRVGGHPCFDTGLVFVAHRCTDALRCNEIRKAIPNISEKMLIQQLKDLMQSGWVDKKDYHEIPPRTEYSLTPLGASFIPILERIYDWGVENRITELVKNMEG